MKKLPLYTPDLTNKNYSALASLFPNAITEKIDENGTVIRAIDADVLAQEINTHVVSGKEERYQFTWPDKKKAILLANSPIAATLRPCREESVNFDSTENLYIEGDNLDVLKLLRETYLNRVKMIYIDPPYNTGNDFIYEDDFAEESGEFKKRDRQYDEDGNRMVRNLDSNGRFHTDWLNMIYPRLRIARDLLTDDGVIFISIDDNEVENIRKICNESFGEENFITQIIWKKRSTPPNDKIIGAAHEYIIIYAKNTNAIFLNLRERTREQIERYKNPDNHKKGPWVPGDLGANIKGGRYVESLYFPIRNPYTNDEHYPPQNGNWRFNKATIDKLMANNEIYFGEDGKGRPKLKRFLCDVKEGITYTSIWDFVPLNTQGSTEMTGLLGNIAVFDNPKPVGLLKEICKLGSTINDIILDFFSGSATTAHVVMQLNAEDSGKRKFIMVQLPEVCAKDSEAAKVGYKNICEIGKERIRRTGKKIVNESPLDRAELDIGFRVLKLDSSNMKDVY
jgi:adenine-specific DNA-methyltransferase